MERAIVKTPEVSRRHPVQSEAKDQFFDPDVDHR